MKILTENVKKPFTLIDADLYLYRAAAAAEEETDWGDDVWSLSTDLKEAKVFVSILGGSSPGVMETLSRKRGFIQSKVSKRVVLRNTPVLSFRVDASASRGVDMVNLLDEVAKLPTAPPEEEEE